MTARREPSLALQSAITAALAAAGGVGVPVRDQFPENFPPPYVQTGDDIVSNDKIDCLEGACTVRTTLHVFSDRTSGQRRQAKTIAGAIVACLDEAALDLSPDWGLVSIEHLTTQVVDDPDGSYQTVVIFSALLDPA